MLMMKMNNNEQQSSNYILKAKLKWGINYTQLMIKSGEHMKTNLW